MAYTCAKLSILGNEKETKKSHLITKFVISNGGKYEEKSTINESINIESNNDNNQNELLTFEISAINISPTYNLTKIYKSTYDEKIKTLYNSSDIIFIIYNVCNSKSFENAIKYYEQYEENKNNMLNPNIIIVLIGHKFGSYTSFKRAVEIEDGQKYASKQNSFFFEVSTNDNSIKSLFANIGKLHLDTIKKRIIINNNNISPKIAKMMSIPQIINNPSKNKNKNKTKTKNNYEMKNDLNEEYINDSNSNLLLSKMNILHEKISDYENIVYSLEHTLTLHEKDKKHLFDKSMQYESESIQLKLEMECRQRQIDRQNDEINKLISDLRNKTNIIEELKNKNMSNKRSKPKPPRKGSSIVSESSYDNQSLLINEKPINSRPRSQTTKDNNKNDNNIFSGITNAFKMNIFSPKTYDKDNKILNDEKEQQIGLLLQKCEKLQTMNEILKKVNEEKNDEIEILKQSDIDIMKQLDMKQKEINHLRECLQDNQIGFTRYKDETEQKLNKWKAEKIYWFDKYKHINTQNSKLIEEKRKLERENRKLEKSKNKWKERALTASYMENNNNNQMVNDNIGDDIIQMDRITIHTLNGQTLGLNQFDDTLWSIPQLLRDFKTVKTNYYNNLMEKIMEFADDNENGMDNNNDEIVINLLFYTIIECHKLIEKINDSISVDIMFDRMGKNKDMIFEKMDSKFNEKFQIWFDDQEGSELESDFKQYIQVCLKYCILLKYFKLELFPNNKLKFEIDGILNYGDFMERDNTFDGTPNDNEWYCSFPSIIKNENRLNEKEILEIINNKAIDKYNIFHTKMWMYQCK